MDKIIEELKILDDFDFTGFNNKIFEKYKDLFFNTFPKTCEYLTFELDTKGTLFSRARKSKNLDDFLYLKNLWHPEYGIEKIGRLNYPLDRILYTSENDSTAMIEVAPEIGDFVAIINFEIPHKELIKCIDFGHSKKFINESTFNNKAHKYYYDFIVKKCQERVKDEEAYKYAPTILAATSMKGNNFDAFAFKSVANNYSRTNFAFRPEFAKQFVKFKKIRIVKVTEQPEDEKFKVICLFEGNTLDNKNKFDFLAVEGCSGHIIEVENSNSFNNH